MSALHTNLSSSLLRFTPAAHKSLMTRVSQMAALYRQRRALAALDADQLDDLGLTRTQAETEAARPIWDIPNSWD